MAVNIGDQAPDFTLLQKVGDDINKVSLNDFQGKKLVLLFFPLAGSGVCTTELCGVSEDWDAYKNLNAEVIGISIDGPHAQELWAKQENITIPLLSDFNKEASTAYGVLYDVFVPGVLDMNGVAKRSAFVVDESGKIVHMEVLENALEMPDLGKVKAALS